LAGLGNPQLGQKDFMEILTIVIQIMLPLVAVALGLQLMHAIGRWN
jgi:hypothetical protein